MERRVKKAVQMEKIARLEAEIQLQSLRLNQESSIFSASEKTDFTYIYNKLNRFEPVTYQHIRDERKAGKPLIFDLEENQGPIKLVEYFFSVNLILLLSKLSGSKKHIYESYEIKRIIRESLKEQLPQNLPSEESFQESSCPDPANELLMYGLLERIYENETDKYGSQYYFQGTRSFFLLYPPKSERFKY